MDLKIRIQGGVKAVELLIVRNYSECHQVNIIENIEFYLEEYMRVQNLKNIIVAFKR